MPRKRLPPRPEPIIIFPQGTRVAPGAEAPYLPGIAALYRQLGIPVVPVALNSGVFWPRHSIRRKPGTIVLEYLPIIEPGLNRREFMARSERRHRTRLAHLRGDRPTGITPVDNPVDNYVRKFGAPRSHPRSTQTIPSAQLG